jgi:anti-sigma factor RsiW
LVAFQDGELAPSEHTQVREHLDQCVACANLERRLEEVTPRPFIEVDPELQDTMWRRLDAAIDAAFRRHAALPHPSRLELWWRWLAEETTVPTGAMLAYAALLLVAITWGAHNWWTAQQLQLVLDRHDASAPVQVVVPAEIPADQYRPAAWVPEDTEP